jgi:predicted NBD/HSP70 family sugar kinase
LNQKLYVYGGGFVYYSDLLLEKLKEKLKQGNKLYNPEKIPEIITAKLGNDAGIIGASLIR